MSIQQSFSHSSSNILLYSLVNIAVAVGAAATATMAVAASVGAFLMHMQQFGIALNIMEIVYACDNVSMSVCVYAHENNDANR